MKKIIAAFDALKLSPSTRDYTIDIAREISANVTGVFIEPQQEHAEGSVKSLGEKKKLVVGHRKDRREVLKTFETSCRDAHVNYTLNREHQLPIHELLNESVYADLMVINASETFTPYPQTPPTRFIRQLLAETQCPVFVVPDNYSHIDKLILLYDGSPSSVYAIKVFNYLFKSQDGLDVEVVTVLDHEDEGQLSNVKLIRDFMNRHYPQATYTMLKGQPEDVISEYISRQKGSALVVMGGYQRSSVLKSFKVTVTDTLMKKLRFPLFIAFNK